MSLCNIKFIACVGMVCVLCACSEFRASDDSMPVKNWQHFAQTIPSIELPSGIQQEKVLNYYVIPGAQSTAKHAVASAPTSVFTPPNSQFKHK